MNEAYGQVLEEHRQFCRIKPRPAITSLILIRNGGIGHPQLDKSRASTKQVSPN